MLLAALRTVCVPCRINMFFSALEVFRIPRRVLQGEFCLSFCLHCPPAYLDPRGRVSRVPSVGQCGERRGVRGPLTRDNSNTDREGWRAEEARRGKLSGQRGDQGAVANTIILQRYLADSHCSTILYLDHFWKREKFFDGAGLPYESA